MVKWADYLVSEVRYSNGLNKKHIESLKTLADYGDSIESIPKILTRTEVITAIENRNTFCTIIKNGQESWTKGKNIIKIRIGNEYYLKTISNITEEDNLDNLPEF